MDANLPDGVLLIKALEAAVVQIAKEDAQAAFRLSTSRQQLALDQRPTELGTTGGLFVCGPKPSWNLYQTSWKQFYQLLSWKLYYKFW